MVSRGPYRIARCVRYTEQVALSALAGYSRIPIKVYSGNLDQFPRPRLRALLEDIIPKNNCPFDYEVTHNFPGIGRKVMLLNARQLRRRQGQDELILLAIEDITALRERQQKVERLVRQKEVLVQEIHHRVKNNLQSIVSLLSLHAGYTDNVHAKNALAEAGARVQAIARLHERLYASENLGEVNLGEYLGALADDLQNLHAHPEITFKVAMVLAFLRE